MALEGDVEKVSHLINTTFDFLNDISGMNSLRRYDNGEYLGRVSLTGFEVIAIGVAKNLDAIMALPDPREFIRNKMNTFWDQQEVETFVSPGLRGTVRIQRTVPFGDEWFRP